MMYVLPVQILCWICWYYSQLSIKNAVDILKIFFNIFENIKISVHQEIEIHILLT